MAVLDALNWPVLKCPRLAGFEVSPEARRCAVAASNSVRYPSWRAQRFSAAHRMLHYDLVGRSLCCPLAPRGWLPWSKRELHLLIFCHWFNRTVRLGMIAPLLHKAMAEAFRDTISRKKQGVGQMADDWRGRRTPQSDLMPIKYEKNSTSASDDPLCSTTGCLVAWESSLLPLYVAIRCKLLQTTANNRNCCGLFTNCCNRLQIRENLPIQRPEVFAPFPS